MLLVRVLLLLAVLLVLPLLLEVLVVVVLLGPVPISAPASATVGRTGRRDEPFSDRMAFGPHGELRSRRVERPAGIRIDGRRVEPTSDRLVLSVVGGGVRRPMEHRTV